MYLKYLLLHVQTTFVINKKYLHKKREFILERYLTVFTKIISSLLVTISIPVIVYIDVILAGEFGITWEGALTCGGSEVMFAIEVVRSGTDISAVMGMIISYYIKTLLLSL